MNFIALIIFFIIGLMVTSFTLLPVLIIFNFGIPFTNKLEEKKVLNKNNGITRRYLISALILSVIFITMLFVTYNYFPAGLWGLIIGGGMAIMFGLGKIGENESNVADYFKNNEQHLNKTVVEDMYSQVVDKK